MGNIFYLSVLILLFIFLVFINFKFTKSLFSPGVIFSSVWLVCLVGLLLFQSYFYAPVGVGLLLILGGVATFSVFSILGILSNVSMDKISKENEIPNTTLLSMNIILLALIVLLPYYFSYLFNFVPNATLENYFQQIHACMQNVPPRTSGINFLLNLPVISFLLTYAYAILPNKTRLLKVFFAISVCISFTYAISQGTKGNAIYLFLTLVAIYFLKADKKSFSELFKKMSLAFLLIFLFFILAIYCVNFGSQHVSGGFLQLIKSLIADYWLGGIVAFNGIIGGTFIVHSDYTLLTIFQQLSDYFLGTHYNLMHHLPFFNIGHGFRTNVYTIFWPYYNAGGGGGVFIFTMILGFVLGVLYRGSRTHIQFALLYAISFPALVFSFFFENFYTNLNFYSKAVIFYFFIFSFIPWLTSWLHKLRLVESKKRQKVSKIS